MGDRNNPNFVGRNLIENTVGESAENITAPGPTEDGADKGIRQNTSYGSVKLGDEREAKLGIRTRGIKDGDIVQLAESEWKNDQLHFSVARTLARASAIGMT
jgi:hypothetical protein